MMLPYPIALDVGRRTNQRNDRRSPNTVVIDDMPLLEGDHRNNSSNSNSNSNSNSQINPAVATTKAPRASLLNPRKQPRYDHNWDESSRSSRSSESDSETDDDDDDFSVVVPTDKAKRRRIHDSEEENSIKETESEEESDTDGDDDSFIDDSRLHENEESISSPPSSVRFVHPPTTKKKKRTQVLWNTNINNSKQNSNIILDNVKSQKKRNSNTILDNVKGENKNSPTKQQRIPGGRQPLSLRKLPLQKQQQQQNQQQSKFTNRMSACKQVGKHPMDQSQEQERKNAATAATGKQDKKISIATAACQYRPKLLPIGTKIRRQYNTGWFEGEIIEASPNLCRIRYEYDEIEELYDDEEVLLGAVAYILKHSPKYKTVPIMGMRQNATAELSAIGKGTLLRKKYQEGWFSGVIVNQDCASAGTWFVRYEDGEEQAIQTEEVNMCTVAFLLHKKPEYCQDLLRLVTRGINTEISNNEEIIDLTADDDTSPTKRRASLLKPKAKRGAFDNDADTGAKKNDTPATTTKKKGGTNRKFAISKCPGSAGDVINSRSPRRSSKRSKVPPTRLADQQGKDAGGDRKSKSPPPESKAKSPQRATKSISSTSEKPSKFKKRRVVGTSIRKRYNTGWFNGEIIKTSPNKTQVQYADDEKEYLSDAGMFSVFFFRFKSCFGGHLLTLFAFTELDVAIGSYDIHTNKLRQARPGPGTRVRKRYDQGYVIFGG